MPQLGIGLFIGDTDGDSIVGPVIDGVIMAEDGAYIITESGVDKLAFEPTGNVTRSYANSDDSLLLTVTGSSAAFTWPAVGGATHYKVVVFKDVFGQLVSPVLTGTNYTVDLNTFFSQGDVLTATMSFSTDGGTNFTSKPSISGITF